MFRCLVQFCFHEIFKEKWPFNVPVFFFLFAVTRLLTCYNLEALAAGHTFSPAIFYYTNSWTFRFVPLLCGFTADVRDLPVREFDTEAP